MQLKITITSFTFLFLLNFSFQVLAQPKKILFIGNSYTGVNDLPGLVQSVALANGDSITIDSYTPGGATFEGHAVDQNVINKIYSQQWDFVVLQEQSQRPSFSPTSVAVWVYPYAEILDSMIHDNNPCTETVFYMTWGRKNGDASNCAVVPEVCTYEGMQARLRESYLEMALLNNCTVSPVGAAWRYMRSLNPAFDLYQPDESHPSLHGSYLAACTFYATLFHKSPVGNPFTASLPAADVATIQNAVHAVVNDSITLWYEHGNIPFASFSYTSQGNNVQFQNHTLNASVFTWDFGDGNSSTSLNPSHTYAINGTYSVSLVVNSGCKSDSITQTITTGITALPEIKNDCIFHYNSGTGNLILDCDQPVKEIKLFDIQGRLIRNAKFNSGQQQEFQTGELPTGIYLVRIVGDGFEKAEKISRQ